MSQGHVLRFFEAVKTDEVVTERLRALGANLDEFAQVVTDLAQERGFIFDPSDVGEALEALARKSEEEVPDRDRSTIAEGSWLI
jgi:Nif11 domain